MYTQVKDSGKRESFQTGAVRDTAEGKGRYDLLPTYAIHRLAQHFENGAKKYGDENWRKGIPLRRFLDSGLRHAMKYLEGQRDEDHMAAAVWNFMALIETEEMIRRGILPVELNNLPNFAERDVEKVDEEEAQAECVYEKSGGRGLLFYKFFQGVPVCRLKTSRDQEPWFPVEDRKPADFRAAIKAGVFVPVDADKCGTVDGVNPLPAPMECGGV